MSDEKCDVLVVGGGPAGLAAAIGAAREGADVVLLEKYGALGGLATQGMVTTICGLYHRGFEEPRWVTDGFPREFAEKLQAEAGTVPLEIVNGLRVLPFDPWSFARTGDRMIHETRGIRLALHTTLLSVRRASDTIREARALVYNRPVGFLPVCIVDCTGEATAIVLGRGEAEMSHEEIAPAIVFSLRGIAPELADSDFRLAALRRITRALDAQDISRKCQGVSFMPFKPSDTELFVKASIDPPTHVDWNFMTFLEIRGREIVDELIEFLREEVDGFANATRSRVAPQVGVRVGRRARGWKTLREEDVLQAKKSDTGVARGVWPLEEWKRGSRPVLTHLPENDFYEIPEDCMRAEGLTNFFMGGRCIGASPRAMASARVIGTALGTGWAAGVMAAARAHGGRVGKAVRDIRESIVSSADKPESRLPPIQIPRRERER